MHDVFKLVNGLKQSLNDLSCCACACCKFISILSLVLTFDTMCLNMWSVFSSSRFIGAWKEHVKIKNKTNENKERGEKLRYWPYHVATDLPWKHT